LIRAWVKSRYVTLGTDGFGRSDTRKALRKFFEIDRKHIALGAIKALSDEGTIDPSMPDQCLARYGLSGSSPAPWLA
jgi:pyruvate dehydrogenase E1 component